MGKQRRSEAAGAGAALLSPLLPARRSPVPGLAGPAGWRWAFVTHYPSSPSDDTFTASRTGLPPARQPRSLAGGQPGSASSCAGAEGLGGGWWWSPAAALGPPTPRAPLARWVMAGPSVLAAGAPVPRVRTQGRLRALELRGQGTGRAGRGARGTPAPPPPTAPTPLPPVSWLMVTSAFKTLFIK